MGMRGHRKSTGPGNEKLEEWQIKLLQLGSEKKRNSSRVDPRKIEEFFRMEQEKERQKQLQLNQIADNAPKPTTPGTKNDLEIPTETQIQISKTETSTLQPQIGSAISEKAESTPMIVAENKFCETLTTSTTAETLQPLDSPEHFQQPNQLDKFKELSPPTKNVERKRKQKVIVPRQIVTDIDDDVIIHTDSNKTEPSSPPSSEWNNDMESETILENLRLKMKAKENHSNSNSPHDPRFLLYCFSKKLLFAIL